jgi:Tfp pilus assembly protein PilP
MNYLLLFFLVSLLGCSPNSLEDYHHEGQSIVKKLIEDLKPIQSREELELALPILKKRFEALVDVMIASMKFQDKHEGEFFEEKEEYAFSLDDELLEELKRVYQLEKGRELIEKAEREPLLRLDACKRNLAKQRSRMK